MNILDELIKIAEQRLTDENIGQLEGEYSYNPGRLTELSGIIAEAQKFREATPEPPEAPRVLVQIWRGLATIEAEPGVNLIHLDYDCEGRNDIVQDATGTACQLVHRGLVADDVELSSGFDEQFKFFGG